MPAATSGRRKSKAAAILKRKQRAAAYAKCRLFNLPPEVRNRIYEYVFAPAPIIELRKERTSSQRRSSAAPTEAPVIRCDQITTKRASPRKIPPKWRNSVSAIILVDKQTHNEARPLLYRSCLFLFEPKSLAHAFLNIVPRVDLRNIRNVRIDHQYPSYESLTAEVLRAKYNADCRFFNMCHQLAQAIPNVTSLILTITYVGTTELKRIIPELSAPENTHDLDYLNNKLPCSQPLKPLAQLKKLKKVEAHVSFSSGATFFDCFQAAGYASFIRNNLGGNDAQVEDASKSWSMWCTHLHRSLAECIERMILREEEQDVWKDHLKMLDGYQKWRADPLSSWATYFPDEKLAGEMLAKLDDEP